MTRQSFHRQIANITALLHIGIDLAQVPDRTAYWPSKKPFAAKPDKRAKIKAARKQRNAK